MPNRSWTRLSSRSLADYDIFRLREDRYRFAPTGVEADFVICDSADWVLVIPVTDDGQVVLIHQYRHGVQQVVVEIPGGFMDREETPEATAVRELREETGYVARRVRYLGTILPHPAVASASCHVVVAEGCSLDYPATPDPLERIKVVLQPLDTVRDMMTTGELNHAQVIAAFALMVVTTSHAT